MLKYTYASLKHSAIPHVPLWGLVNYNYSDSGADCSIAHNLLLPPHFCHMTPEKEECVPAKLSSLAT